MAEMDVMGAGSDQDALQEKYLKPLEQLEEGQIVEGTVVQVDSDYVYLDVYCKSEGKIPVNEFETLPELNEKVSVLLIKKEARNGEPVVSKKKADMKSAWKEVRNAFNEQIPVEGTIVKVIKGGFEVDLGIENRAFLPISKTDIIRVEKPEEYLNLKDKFLIERLYNDKRINIVVSRRTWMEKEVQAKREEFFNTAKEGDEITGAVKSFTSFGAFIDLGGFDGLLHINDMSWGHVTRPKDFVKKGQEIKLKVIKLDKEEQKINLSLKDFAEDPWESFLERYRVDDKVHGKVTKLTDFGAFIEIEEGIEGLAHISELSWVKKIKHPSEVVSIGDDLEVMILGYDVDARRVSLGVKQVLPNPWDEIGTHYTVGMKLTRTIKNVTNAGAFIELEEGIDGFLHVDDYSWTKRVQNAKSVFTPGEEMEVQIIRVDSESRRIRLGVKQLSDDPWSNLVSSTPKGSIVDGVVTNVTDFGVFVRVSGDIEGLIYKNQISSDREANIEELLAGFKEGDKVKAVITELSPEKQKLSLSIKELKYKEERQDIEKYIHDDDADTHGGTFTLADALQKDEE
ncbi:MAG: 30S ribosomal protein S1 [Spirochaetaceae bacterium]|jgi:small subunit ribosomal protein S1|nr:30S ribosomal protein S1 [Spirochaetaceae bacterium]